MPVDPHRGSASGSCGPAPPPPPQSRKTHSGCRFFDFDITRLQTMMPTIFILMTKIKQDKLWFTPKIPAALLWYKVKAGVKDMKDRIILLNYKFNNVRHRTLNTLC